MATSDLGMGPINLGVIPTRNCLLACMGSWTLRSGIRGALVSTWRMLKWGVINFLDTNKTYETEPVQDPHHVEIDRMPPPPAEMTVAESGPTGVGRWDSTPVRRSNRHQIGDVEAPWEMLSPNGNRSREIASRPRRSTSMSSEPTVLNRMVEASRSGRQE